MSELIVFPNDDVAFARVLEDVTRFVDRSARLPEWPFVPAVANVDVCQFDRAMAGTFVPVLQALAANFGDTVISYVTLDTDPERYRSLGGIYPAFQMAVAELDDRFWEYINFEPTEGPPGCAYDTAQVFAMVGDSGQWAVWAQRSWELALILSPVAGGPWLETGEVPFEPIDTALHDFTMPGYSGPPTTEAGEQLMRTARVRGSLAPTEGPPE